MFPTYVGVNRKSDFIAPDKRNVPHVCGGEPYGRVDIKGIPDMFPAYVGVNRTLINPV